MSYELKGDTYRWTYCDTCKSVNGDAYGQIILCKCDRKEVNDSLSKIKKISKKESKIFKDLFTFKEAVPKVSKKKKVTSKGVKK